MADVCVVGLGYVGLPLALAFDRAGHEVVGFDIDEQKVATLRSGTDPTDEIEDRRLRESDLSFTSRPDIEDREFVIITVPTPVDDSKTPDLSVVEAASRTVGRYVTPDTTVVLESTVYPGATREVVVPALEETSRMTAGEDFSVGYSPERVVPGDGGKGLSDIVKIVSGLDDETARRLATLYGDIIDEGVHRAPSIEIAEAAKCLENTQRDLNIAFVNEFAIACDRLGVDAQAVLEAAATKWNFHEYEPGLVGGHCLPVDPYYLVHAFENAGYSPSLIKSARETNEYVSEHVADLVSGALAKRTPAEATETPEAAETAEAGSRSNAERVPPDETRDTRGTRETAGASAVSDGNGERVLLLGMTYKADTADVRTDALRDLISELEARGMDPAGFDPNVETETLTDEFRIPVEEDLAVDGYDALVVTVGHEEFRRLDPADLAEGTSQPPALVDVPGAFDGQNPEEAGFVYKRFGR